LEVKAGQLVALIGANGAGKATLRAISGLVAPRSGSMLFEGKDIAGAKPPRVVASGIAHCPEGRRVFPHMTVEENLDMGAYLRTNAAEISTDRDRIYAEFPRLAERRRQAAGTLSGGEQQMLAIGRALMSRPRLIMFDEPSLGLRPTSSANVCDHPRHPRCRNDEPAGGAERLCGARMAITPICWKAAGSFCPGRAPT
jgi:branched-chain amino acid transport system ATP-binding protein